MRVSNAMLRMKKDKQVDIGKTSLLELNSMDCQMCSRQSLSNILVINYIVGHLT